jgi:cleavage and polyadenylation specificity factor subunit 1
VFKNLILFGDAFKSMWFASLQVSFPWLREIDKADKQDEPYKFTVIGKDLQDVSLSAADFLVHDGQMTFISNDKEGVLRLVDFDPAGKLINSWYWTKLTQRSRFIQW